MLSERNDYKMKQIILRGKDSSLVLDGLCYGADLYKAKNLESMYELCDVYREKSKFFDTARIYGNLRQNGKGGSEEALGKYLKLRGITNTVTICTKGGHPPLLPMLLRMKCDRLDKKSLQKDLEQSLRFLQRDYIDLYLLHRDSGRDVGEIIITLNDFIRQGKVRFIGASNWTLARILEANDFARSNGLQGFSIGQVMYSYARLAKPMMDKTSVKASLAEKENYIRAGMPFMAYSSQAGGFFSKYDAGTIDKKNPYLTEENIRKYTVVKQLSEKYKVSVAAIALKYLTGGVADIIPIMAPHSMKHLKEVLEVYDFDLSPEDYGLLKKEEVV
jgi:aryl-alcohol dehydrogenase-like predicted oxidoreductase